MPDFCGPERKNRRRAFSAKTPLIRPPGRHVNTLRNPQGEKAKADLRNNAMISTTANITHY